MSVSPPKGGGRPRSKSDGDERARHGSMSYELVWIKAIHFVSTAMSSAWGRYQVIYLISKQQSPTGIGLLRAAGLLCKFFVTPMWGAYSDEKVDSTLPLISSAIMCMLMLELYRSPRVLASFWLLLVLKCLRSSANGQGTLVDALTLRVLERHEGAGYGEQRLWTGVSWGLSCFAIGYLADAFGWDVLFTWTYFCTFLLLLLVGVRPAVKADLVEKPSDAPRKRAFENLAGYCRAVPTIPGMSSFIAIMVIYGMAMSLVESLMYLQMARDFGASKSLVGVVTLVGTLTEYPCFHYSKRLLRRHGPCSLLRVAHLVMILRLLLLSTVTSTTHHVLLPLIQLLHGPTFALTWSAAVEWSAEASPHAIKATSQSALSTAYYVVGAGLGSVIWSTVYEIFGARLAYLLGAMSIALSFSLLLSRLKRPGHDDDIPSLCHRKVGFEPPGSPPEPTRQALLDASL